MTSEGTEKARVRSLANKKNYQMTFESDHGKKVLWDLMKKGGMLEPSFCEKDSHATAYNEGRRAMILGILNYLKVDLVKLEKIIEKGNEYDEELW